MVSKEPATSTLDFEKFFQSKKRKAGFATPFKTSTVSITPKGSFAESFRKIADSVPKSGDETLNDQIKEVNDNLRAVAQSLNKIYSSLIEEQKKKQKLVNAKKRKDKIEESKERSSKAEKLLEGGGALSKALKAPFKTVNKALGNPFEKIKNALLLLGIGWLTDKFVKAFQADRDGDKDLFEQLKSEITKGLAVLGGIFALGSLGVGALISGIAKVGGFLAKWLIGKPLQFLIWKPLKFIGRKILERLGVIKKPPTTTTPKTRPVSNRQQNSQQRRKFGSGARNNVTPKSTPTGNTSARLKGPSPFEVAQQQKAVTQSISQAPVKQQNAFQRAVDFLRGGKNKAFRAVKDIVKSPGFGRVLGGALKVAFIYSKVKERLDKGYSPVKSVLPLIPEILITLKGAAIGGGLSGALGLVSGPGAVLTSILGAVAGGYVGGFIGSQFTNLLDPAYDAVNADSAFGWANDPITKALQSVGMIPKTEEDESVEAQTPALPAAKPTPPAAPVMMSETEFYNASTTSDVTDTYDPSLLDAETYEQYTEKFKAKNPSAAQEEPTATVTASEVASTVEPKESESSVQASEMASQATTTRARQLQSAALEGEGQKVSVDISTVNIPPPAPAAPTPGGGGSGIPALKSFDGTNPYRLLSRSIYNVLS